MGKGRPGGNPDLGKIGRHFTSESARYYSKLGAEAKRKKKLQRERMEETLKILMNMPLKKSGKLYTAEDILSLDEAEKMNVDVQTAILVAIIRNAQLGDTDSARFIRDTIGEKPSDKVQVDQSLTVEAWAKKHKVKF